MVPVVSRSLAGADPDAMCQRFAVDMFYDDGKIPSLVFPISKSDQLALRPFVDGKLIRLSMTMLRALPHIRRECRIWLRPAANR